MSELEIDIRAADEDQLDFLDSIFSPHSLSKHHHQRYDVQEHGDGIYLIAWLDDKPVGHFLLEWSGPGTDGDVSGEYPFPTPYLSSGETVSEYRRKGIATRLIGTAENLARDKGFREIGLAVGSTDNPDARRLYGKLGYSDWGKGEFEASWEYVAKDGRRGRESEVCIYMFKALEQGF